MSRLIRWPLLTILLITNLVQAQEIKQVFRQNTNEHNLEYYYVLKADTNIKHGPYRMVNFFGGQPIVTGFYDHGRKDSTWREFCPGPVFVQATGNYLRDKKKGVWTYYCAKDTIEQKYDHSRHEVVYYLQDSIKRKYQVIRAKDTIRTPLNRPPLYIGGNLTIMAFLATHMQYPQAELNAGVHGTVEIGVVVDTNGHASDYFVSKSVHKNLDRAALETIKTLPDHWIPALLKGKKVKSVYIQKVPFVLF